MRLMKKLANILMTDEMFFGDKLKSIKQKIDECNKKLETLDVNSEEYDEIQDKLYEYSKELQDLKQFYI